jgi:hypothetical protein
MELSLEQAIEIHAEVLKRVHGNNAPAKARERAAQLAALGDDAGDKIWRIVADVAVKLLVDEPPEDWRAEA